MSQSSTINNGGSGTLKEACLPYTALPYTALDRNVKTFTSLYSKLKNSYVYVHIGVRKKRQAVTDDREVYPLWRCQIPVAWMMLGYATLVPS